MSEDATKEQIDSVMQDSWKAFQLYRKCSLKQRAEFMRAIATEIEKLGDELLTVAAEETHLTEARLRSERARTCFQLTSYADACEKGDWLDIRIDTAISDRNPPKPDLRKMLVPLGPVVVFGASNFPFAYSTAGGDTASAFAAGCSVVVKAHPAHIRTSEMVAGAIQKAVTSCYMPAGVFAHIPGESFDVGKELIEHRYTKAVGFTGSFTGGRQLFDWASQRKVPIPVFAEMSSINPVFILPGKLNESAEEVAKQYAGSITLGVGQFCTNPGLIIAIDNDDLSRFITALSEEINKTSPANMLHAGIFKNYVERRANALSQTDVETIAVATGEPMLNQGVPTIASASAEAFINNPILHQEVFGPYSMVIRCKNIDEMVSVTQQIEGQLTATLMATEKDLNHCGELVDSLKDICGRFVMNGVPTGVEPCLAMHHGGPYPATTDSRFTSVGADAIKRFARPICFQNWNDEMLPEELKEGNPLKLWRTVNGEMRKGN